MLTSAPFPSRALTALICPVWLAYNRGVEPFSLAIFGLFASMARAKGDLPSLFLILASVPTSRIFLIISRSPVCTATCSAVFSVSGSLQLKRDSPPSEMTSCATSCHPFLMVICRSWPVALAYLHLIKRLTISLCPLTAASITAVPSTTVICSLL
ncbi:hypothetical protein F4803DRAFT_335092 [Xylaria telfairii]|nr:hypothetical protein F4803DRAFT_335092 [Xylaria telfairii]